MLFLESAGRWFPVPAGIFPPRAADDGYVHIFRKRYNVRLVCPD
jgi:hypothetical protein